MIDELTLEVSHKCPLNCIFCSSKNSILGTKPADKLDFGDIEKAIRKFNPKTLRWSGGEPFLYLEKNILEKLSSFFPSIRQIVTTNGMYPNKISRLSDYFSEIRISIFGDKQTHEELTRVRGSWDKAIETLKTLNDGNCFKKRKILITSPYISKNQMQEVKMIAKNFKVGTRITGLVSVPKFSRGRNGIRGLVCSLGGEDCRYYKKRLILPNGKIIHCAVEKTGFKCPHYVKIKNTPYRDAPALTRRGRSAGRP